MDSDRREWSRDLRWGIGQALAVAAGLIAFVGLVHLLTDGSNVRSAGMTFLQVTAAYLGGALIFGILVGLLRPYIGRRAGAAVVGILGMLPFLVLIRGLSYGWTDWSPAEVIAVPVGALLLGSLYGVAAWYGETRPRRPD